MALHTPATRHTRASRRAPAVLPAAELARVLGNAAPFAAGDDTLPTLHAVRRRVTGDTLIADATDRYALFRETYPLTGAADRFDVIVPLPAVRQVRQLLAAARRLHAEAVAELSVAGPATVSRHGADHVVPQLRVAAGDMAVETAGEPGPFPDLDGLIAHEDTLAAAHGPGPFDVTLAPQLLARLAKVRAGGNDGPPAARLTRSTGEPGSTGYPKARPVHAALGDRVRVMVMPISGVRS
jgi:hypothetical protein